MICVNQIEETADQFRSLEIADLTERDGATEMIVAVGVAAGTSERAFAGDFDRKRRTIAAKDSPPRGDDTFHTSNISGASSGATGGGAQPQIIAAARFT
jgi:hypothetical protein